MDHIRPRQCLTNAIDRIGDAPTSVLLMRPDLDVARPQPFKLDRLIESITPNTHKTVAPIARALLCQLPQLKRRMMRAGRKTDQLRRKMISLLFASVRSLPIQLAREHSDHVRQKPGACVESRHRCGHRFRHVDARTRRRTKRIQQPHGRTVQRRRNARSPLPTK